MSYITGVVICIQQVFEHGLSSISSIVLRGKVSERLQPEKMSLEACWKLNATDGRGAKVKWQ